MSQVIEVPQVTLDLERGFTDAKGAAHQKLVFGRRLTGGDLIRADQKLESFSKISFECAIFASALVEFGTLRRDEMRHALLSLNDLERADVEAAYERFLSQSNDGVEGRAVSDDTVRLAFGIRRDGVVYRDVTFGRLLVGYDELEADTKRLTGVERNCFLIGRQVARIASADGAHVVEGELTLEVFEDLDADDLPALREAADNWYESARAAHLQARMEQESGQTTELAGPVN